MTEKVVLWGAGTSRTHRPLWLAREIGIEYEHKPIGPRTGETKTPEYLAINPRHKVPSLIHGDVVMTENAAVLFYMSEIFSTPDWFHVPDDTIGRARLLEWCYFAMTELDAIGIYSIRRHGDLKDIYGDSPIAVQAGKDYFAYQVVRMEEAITEAGPFLLGERMSIADIIFMSCLDAAQRYEVPLPDYLRDYMVRMRARPAYIETYEQNYGREAPDV